VPILIIQRQPPQNKEDKREKGNNKGEYERELLFFWHYDDASNFYSVQSQVVRQAMK
jgi:hypothetical protein